jgi:acyl dehydratase
MVMSVPESAIGLELAPVRSVVEAGRLRFFAKAIGQDSPLYSNQSAAREAGYRDLPVPPTFLFGLKLDAPDPFRWLLDLGVDFRYVLHGTQKFTYHRMAFAGDELLMQSRIADVTQKKAGALEFIVLETEVSRGDEPIATLLETIVIRHPELEVAA